MENKSALLVVTTSLLVFLGGVFSTANAQIPTIERTALIALFNSTDGDNWTDNSGWKEPPLHTDGFAMPGTEDTWFGITLNAGGTAVEEVGLYNNNLSGTIPPELGSLSSIKEIVLGANKLTGSIPPELGNLTNLDHLILSSNELEGSIPEALGNLSNLYLLYLHYNQLSGSIPPQLGNLTSIQVMYLNDNQLTGSIPPELGSLSLLRVLYLSNNQLEGSIPSELGSLTNLLQLWLQSNELTGSIPTSLTGLTGLTHLNIGYNALYTDDSELLTFLNEEDPDWADTQTIAPEDVSATPLSSNSINLSWTPITYKEHSGGYRVLYSTSAGGPHTSLYGTTADKSASQMVVAGLTLDTTYHFVVQTQTNPHGNNQNTVYSEESEEVSASTGTIFGGDVNGDDNVNLGDALLSLQIMTGVEPSATVNKTCDLNGDGKIGTPEIAYVLRNVSGPRQSTAVRGYVYQGIPVVILDDPQDAPEGYAPVADADLKVVDINGEVVATGTTDAGGRFHIEDLPSGFLTLEVRIDPESTESDAAVSFTSILDTIIDLGKIYPVTRNEAISLALTNIPTDALVLGSMQPLTTGTIVYSRDDEQDGPVSVIEKTLEADEWFFFVDLDPRAEFSHDVKYIFVDAHSAEMTTLDETAPPKANFGALWASDRDFIVYEGIDLDNLEYAVIPEGATATPTAEVVQLPDFLDSAAMSALGTSAAAIRRKDYGSGNVSPLFCNEDAASIFTLSIFGDNELHRSMNDANWKQFLGLYGARPNYSKWNAGDYNYTYTAKQALWTKLRSINSQIAARLDQDPPLHSTLILYINGHSTYYKNPKRPSGQLLLRCPKEERSFNPRALFGGQTGELATTKACRVRIFIDTCFAEEFARGIETIFNNLPLQERPDVRIFASSRSNESSYRDGLLTGLLSLTMIWGNEFTDAMLHADGVRLEGGDVEGLLDEHGELRLDLETINSKQHAMRILISGDPEWCEEEEPVSLAPSNAVLEVVKLSDPDNHWIWIFDTSDPIIHIRCEPFEIPPHGQSGEVSLSWKDFNALPPLSGMMNSNGEFSLTGTGTVAGFPNIVVNFDGEYVDTNGKTTETIGIMETTCNLPDSTPSAWMPLALQGTLTIGAAGGLPGGQPATANATIYIPPTTSVVLGSAQAGPAWLLITADKDAVVKCSITSPSTSCEDSGISDINLSDTVTIVSRYNVGGGIYEVEKSYFHFTLPVLPPGTVIDTAIINLYDVENMITPSQDTVPIGYSAGPWDADEITWNNQPNPEADGFLDVSIGPFISQFRWRGHGNSMHNYIGQIYAGQVENNGFVLGHGSGSHARGFYSVNRQPWTAPRLYIRVNSASGLSANNVTMPPPPPDVEVPSYVFICGGDSPPVDTDFASD